MDYFTTITDTNKAMDIKPDPVSFLFPTVL